MAQGEELEWGRARQGLVPDFRLRLSTPDGPSDRLAELKFISAGVSWFPRGVRGKGTDRRAAGLPNNYTITHLMAEQGPWSGDFRAMANLRV